MRVRVARTGVVQNSQVLKERGEPICSGPLLRCRLMFRQPVWCGVISSDKIAAGVRKVFLSNRY